MLDQVLVNDLWSTPSLERKSNAEDNVTLAPRRVKNTRPVGKSAVRLGQQDNSFRLGVIAPNRINRLGNLLAVGPDILYRCAPDRARNSAQTLNARKTLPHARGNKTIPVLTRADG